MLSNLPGLQEAPWGVVVASCSHWALTHVLILSNWGLWTSGDTLLKSDSQGLGVP